MQDLLTAVALIVVFGMATIVTETLLSIIKSFKK
jgi:hypothetical protein